MKQKKKAKKKRAPKKKEAKGKVQSQEPKKVGRPEDYTDELAFEICARIASGESLKRICYDSAMPHRATVHRWLLSDDKKAFRDKYEDAVNVRTENMADELFEIADDGTNDWMEKERADGSTFVALDTEHVQRSRLRTDVRKWYLSKIMPKKYGDKLELGGGIKVENTIDAETAARIAASFGNFARAMNPNHGDNS